MIGELADKYKLEYKAEVKNNKGKMKNDFKPKKQRMIKYQSGIFRGLFMNFMPS